MVKSHETTIKPPWKTTMKNHQRVHFYLFFFFGGGVAIESFSALTPIRFSPVYQLGERRASAKFAGRQKVHVSNKFGFTKYTKKDLGYTLWKTIGKP